MKRTGKSQQLSLLGFADFTKNLLVVWQIASVNSREFRVLEILRRKNRVLQPPADSEIRIIPYDSPLALGMIEITALVQELGRVAQHQIPMSEPGGYIHLELVVGGQPRAFPFAEMWRPASYVHDHVQHFAPDNTAQFRLSVVVDIRRGSPHFGKWES